MFRVEHHGVARIDCKDCLFRRYNMKRGIPLRANDEDQEPAQYYTVANDPTYQAPCRTDEGCPKGDPEEGKQYDFHPLNAAILKRFKELQIPGSSQTESELNSQMLQDCYRIIADLTKQMDKRDDDMRFSNVLIEALYPRRPK